MMWLLAAAAAAGSLGTGPVDYGAESFRVEPRARRAFFDGAVYFARDDMKLTGDHAVAELAPEQPRKQKQPSPRKGAPKQRQSDTLGESIRRFDVQGKVHFVRGARSADADHGLLDTDAKTLVLTGTPEAPPVLRDGSETLSGERILLRLDSEDVEVARPRITLHRSVAEDPSSKRPAPVKVEAASLFVDRSKRVARFTNDVVVRRGDATVRSPRMDARYDGEGQLTALQLRGGVEMRQGERRATGAAADYDARTRKLVLTGDPKLVDRGDTLTGDRIDLSFDSKEVHVERARGRFRPESHANEARP